MCLLFKFLSNFENGPKKKSWAHVYFTQKSIKFFCFFMILCFAFYKKDPDVLFSLLSFSVAIISIQFFKGKSEAKSEVDKIVTEKKIDCFLAEETKKEATKVTLITVLLLSNLIAFFTLKIANRNTVLSSSLFSKAGIAHPCLSLKLLSPAAHISAC
jgi:hypothetical protein